MNAPALVCTLLICVLALGCANNEKGMNTNQDKTDAKDDKNAKVVTLTITEKMFNDKAGKQKLTRGEILEIKLEAQPGTGFGWEIAKNDRTLLEPLGKPTLERPAKKKDDKDKADKDAADKADKDKGEPGSIELQVFRFRAVAAGTNDLELHYKRPFEKDKAPTKTYKLSIQIVDPG